MALSVGLDSAISALRAQQLAVDVASHNIANAQTTGYSRQQVQLEPNGHTSTGWDTGMQAGSGVSATAIRRVRDAFLDFQARQALSYQSQYDTFSTGISQAEAAFNEPSDTGLAAQLGAFFNSWQDVVNDPGSSAARTALVNTATTLASGTQAAASALRELRNNLDNGVSGVADRMNSDAEEIGKLNQQITQAEAAGQTANDLRDQRDNLLDDLAKLGQISYSEQPNHSVTVYLGNHELVSQADSVNIAAVVDPANGGMTKLIFAADGQAVTSTSGKLRGLLDARDTEIPGVLAKLNTVASGLITQVNAIHQAGYGLDGSHNVAFFTGTSAGDIAVNTTIANNPQEIAAASIAGAAGNADSAAAIAALQTNPTMAGGTLTIGQYYNNMVTVLGADVARAGNFASTNGLLAQQVDSQRQAASGVNIDEETASMAMSQKAYQAAARVVTVIDAMLDTLINRMGA